MICSGYVRVRAFEGPLWMKQIQVGDSVLSTDNRYHRVLKVVSEDLKRKKTNVYDINYKIEGKEDRSLHRVSEDTLVRVSDGNRKKVKNLKQGDKIQIYNGWGVVTSTLRIPIDNWNPVCYTLELEGACDLYLDDVLCMI